MVNSICCCMYWGIYRLLILGMKCLSIVSLIFYTEQQKGSSVYTSLLQIWETSKQTLRREETWEKEPCDVPGTWGYLLPPTTPPPVPPQPAPDLVIPDPVKCAVFLRNIGSNRVGLVVSSWNNYLTSTFGWKQWTTIKRCMTKSINKMKRWPSK